MLYMNGKYASFGLILYFNVTAVYWSVEISDLFLDFALFELYSAANNSI